MTMVESETNKSKRILKNTLFLYFRMLFVMVISIYTSRVVLDKLGVIDFGIHSVVGGMTSMFIFFRTSLSNASQRFFSVSLAECDLDRAQKTFCLHQTLYFILSLVVVVVAEIVGLWLLNNKLVIPADRLDAAFWTFQLMVVALVVTLLSIVYDATIIAHENMKIYSYVGIFEGVAKLGIAYLISIATFDRLVFYSALLFGVAVSIRVFYTIYCKRMYQECRFSFVWDKNRAKEASSLVGWNLVGTAVWAVNNQGMDILLNVFFGPIVNAAKAVATQVDRTVNNFVNNFFVAVQPQVTKSYAIRDFDYLLKLFYGSSKYSFFLLWFLCLPLMLCIDCVLSIWLKEVPENAGVFVNLILTYSLINVLNNPIWSTALAVGRLKKYICIGSGVFLMSFPISYIFLKNGYGATSVLVVNDLVRFVYLWVVLHIIKQHVPISIKKYIRTVIVPIVLVVVLSGSFSLMIASRLLDTILDNVLLGIVSTIVNMFFIVFVGLRRDERNVLVKTVKKRFLKNA